MDACDIITNENQENHVQSENNGNHIEIKKLHLYFNIIDKYDLLNKVQEMYL